jgi:acyl-CoA synthetase (AMP-forming)/AMP-acid ligase II
VLATPDAVEQAAALRASTQVRTEPDDQLPEEALLLPFDGALPPRARRGRVWAQDELLALGAAAAVAQGLRPGARVLAALPMFELAGLSAQLLPALLTGAQLNLRPGFEPSDWLQQLRAWQPDTSLLRPTMLGRLVADAGWAITPFGGLKTLALALRHGEAAPDDQLQQACAARGLTWCLLPPPAA